MGLAPTNHQLLASQEANSESSDFRIEHPPSPGSSPGHSHVEATARLPTSVIGTVDRGESTLMTKDVMCDSDRTHAPSANAA